MVYLVYLHCKKKYRSHKDENFLENKVNIPLELKI